MRRFVSSLRTFASTFSRAAVSVLTRFPSLLLVLQVKVLRCVPPIEQKDTLLGQYTAANGKPGYLEDDTVPKGSNCPTFAETVLFINNPRWEGVPFIMKAGKGELSSCIWIREQGGREGRTEGRKEHSSSSTLTSIQFVSFFASFDSCSS